MNLDYLWIILTVGTIAAIFIAMGLVQYFSKDKEEDEDPIEYVEPLVGDKKLGREKLGKVRKERVNPQHYSDQLPLMSIVEDDLDDDEDEVFTSEPEVFTFNAEKVTFEPERETTTATPYTPEKSVEDKSSSDSGSALNYSYDSSPSYESSSDSSGSDW